MSEHKQQVRCKRRLGYRVGAGTRQEQDLSHGLRMEVQVGAGRVLGRLRWHVHAFHASTNDIVAHC